TREPPRTWRWTRPAVRTRRPATSSVSKKCSERSRHVRMSSKLRQAAWTAAILACAAAQPVAADEGGVGFWLPGTYSSLAAVAPDPGWSLPVFYYRYKGSSGANESFAIGGNVTLGVDGTSNLFFVTPTYTFRRPWLGGRPSFSLGWFTGSTETSADAKLAGPNGSVVARSLSDKVSGSGDLAPQLALYWNHGKSGYLGYVLGGIPVGVYDKERLANLGINHSAVDAGAGYTYLDPEQGLELSGTLGFTYNFENPATDYRNGVDAHVDWAASQFYSQGLTHVGAVGYFYD